MKSNNLPKEERKVGLVKEKLYPCPEKHVCVSTQAPEDDEKHYIEPLTYSTSEEEVMQKMVGIINSMRGSKILEQTKNYLRAEFTTLLLRFKDDVEFLLKDGILHFRSQSRIGGFDWGKNRSRMEKIRKSYNKKP